MYFLKKFKNQYALNFQKAQILDEIKHLTETVQSFTNGKDKSEQIVIFDYILQSLIEDACNFDAGRYYKKGKILSDEADTALLYPHINTDGVYWYNAHTNQIIDSVSDFRLAAVFLVAKMKNELTNS